MAPIQHQNNKLKPSNESGSEPMKTPNNKSQGRLSKKRRDAIKGRMQKDAEVANLVPEGTCRPNNSSSINDEYEVINSEDEMDQDAKSVEEHDEEEPENIEPTYQENIQAELQEVTG